MASSYKRGERRSSSGVNSALDTGSNVPTTSYLWPSSGFTIIRIIVPSTSEILCFSGRKDGNWDLICRRRLPHPGLNSRRILSLHMRFSVGTLHLNTMLRKALSTKYQVPRSTATLQRHPAYVVEMRMLL